jgi:hypothetical protein
MIADRMNFYDLVLLLVAPMYVLGLTEEIFDEVPEWHNSYNYHSTNFTSKKHNTRIVLHGVKRAEEHIIFQEQLP